VSPTTIDAILLSQGHYDHTGGVLALLEVTRKNVAIFIHSQAFPIATPSAEAVGDRSVSLLPKITKNIWV
jgi:metal-dependent hydrolase (beta-lactamase superfamily II)